MLEFDGVKSKVVLVSQQETMHFIGEYICMMPLEPLIAWKFT